MLRFMTGILCSGISLRIKSDPFVYLVNKYFIEHLMWVRLSTEHLGEPLGLSTIQSLLDSFSFQITLLYCFFVLLCFLFCFLFPFWKIFKNVCHVCLLKLYLFTVFWNEVHLSLGLIIHQVPWLMFFRGT